MPEPEPKPQPPPMKDNETFLDYAKRISNDPRTVEQIKEDSLNPKKGLPSEPPKKTQDS